MKQVSLLLAGFLLICFPVFAAEKTGEKSSKALDFDGELVEGVNKQPLDSLNQVSESDSGKYKLHLYQKRTSYKDEFKETIRELTETY